MANDLHEAKAARDAVLIAQTGRADRHAASQRTLSGRCPGSGCHRRARTHQQGGDCLELPRPSLARPAGSPADPRGGHGLAQMAPDQAVPPLRSARLFRIPPLPRVLQRNSRSVDEPRHRHGSPRHWPTLSRTPPSPTAAFSPGPTGARIPIPSRRSWITRKVFSSAIPPASATIPTASRASWETKATMVNIGGEGSQRWKLVEEKGTHESNPFVHRAARPIRLNAAERHGMSWSQKLLTGAVEKTYGALPFISDSNPSHMRNWLECLRTRNQPNASVEQRPGSIGGRNHGGPRPTGGQKTLLECPDRGNCRGIPGRLHGRTRAAIENQGLSIRRIVLALGLSRYSGSFARSPHSSSWWSHLSTDSVRAVVPIPSPHIRPYPLGISRCGHGVDHAVARACLLGFRSRFVRAPLCPGGGASRHQKHHRTGRRSPDRGGSYVTACPGRPQLKGRVWNAVRASVTAQMPDGTSRPAYTRFFAGTVTNVATA